MNINRIRKEIDNIDSEIVKLLSERSFLVTEAGKTKKTEMSVQDSKRVDQVIKRIKQKALKAGLDPVIAETIYRNIVECFINKEMKEFNNGRTYFPDI